MMEQEKLEDLQREKSSLGRDLRLAIENADGAEISRLKQRESTIEADIFSAEILALKAQITHVEADLALAYKTLSEAKETSKNTDALVVSQIGILRNEIHKLNSDAMGKLVAVKTAENSIKTTQFKLSELNNKLAKLLQQ